MTITFIGTVHSDPDGEERLLKALEYVGPDAITYEGIEDKAKENELKEQAADRIKSALLDRGFTRSQASSISRNMLSPSYEEGTAWGYAAKNGIPFIFAESEELALEPLRISLEGMLRNIKSSPFYEPRKIHKGPPTTLEEKKKMDDKAREMAAKKYEESRRGLEIGETEPRRIEAYLNLYRENIIGPRDAFMEKIIRETLEKYDHVAHIGGTAHLYPDPIGDTLRSKLDDVDHEIILLDEIDELEASL